MRREVIAELVEFAAEHARAMSSCTRQPSNAAAMEMATRAYANWNAWAEINRRCGSN